MKTIRDGRKIITRLSDKEIIDELRSDSLRNRVRKVLSSSAGNIEQACAQRQIPSAVEIRRMEFEAADKIIEIVQSHSSDLISDALEKLAGLEED